MKRNNWKKTLIVVLMMLVCLETISGEALADQTQSIWNKSGSTVTVATPYGSRTYHLYNQLKCKGRDKYYYRSYGCVTTGVSIAASGFGVKAEPWAIHMGKSSSKKSERYALKQLKVKRKRRQAISLRLASQILTNMGIPNRRVTSFTTAAAEEEIRAHLLQGKPVIVKVKRGQHHGVKFTNHHHTLVLVGIVGDYVAFINPITGNMNSARSGKMKKLRLRPSLPLMSRSAFPVLQPPKATIRAMHRA